MMQRCSRSSSDSSFSLSSENETKKLPPKQESRRDHFKEEDEINAALKAMEISGQDKLGGEVPLESEIDEALKKMEATEKKDPDEQEQKKFNARCQYWPNCIRESDCYYLHPKSPCEHFPNCYYGDKCFFIHPICPSNGKCTDKFCIYTHTRPSKTGTSLQNVEELLKNASLNSSQDSINSPTGRGDRGSKPEKKTDTVCKYRGKCRKFACEFKHPPKCKFGMACRNIDSCAFWHKVETRKSFAFSTKPSSYKPSIYNSSIYKSAAQSSYSFKSNKLSKGSTAKLSATYKPITSKSATLKPAVSKEKKNA